MSGGVVTPAPETLRYAQRELSSQSAADSVRDAIRALSAYTLEMREASDKLDQNESPFDWPQSFKREVLDRVARRPWNLYPDFELVRVRTALANAYALNVENVLVGNGSNELLLATLTTFVAPGRPVIIPSPSFALYEKLATILGGDVRAIPLDPETGVLPVAAMLREIERCSIAPLVVVCSPNNPTGGVLLSGELDQLLATNATVLFDRAYGEFANDVYPPLHERLITLSTFSKAWGLAGLRLGWLSSTAGNVREIRKVKLPYNLNFISEEAAVLALEKFALRDEHVTFTIAERERMITALSEIDGITPFRTKANFITFRVGAQAASLQARRLPAVAVDLFSALLADGILVRDVSKYPRLENCLRVSIGTREQNDRFISSVREFMS